MFVSAAAAAFQPPFTLNSSVSEETDGHREQGCVQAGSD